MLSMMESKAQKAMDMGEEEEVMARLLKLLLKVLRIKEMKREKRDLRLRIIQLL